MHAPPRLFGERNKEARLTNVLAELPHEGNAEPADLVVGLALGVEVASTLATAHVDCGQVSIRPSIEPTQVSLTASKGILEDLLEAQELEDRQVDGGVEAETALVGAESRVELHAVAFVHLALALVILPHNAELDDSLGNGDDLEGLLVLGVLLEEGGGLEGGDELWDVLVD